MAGAPRVFEAARISYQGIPCCYGSYSCPQGLSTGRGYVLMPQVEFERRIAGDPWLPHGEAQRGGTVARDRDPVGGGGALLSPLDIRGPLVFAGAGGATITLPSIYIADQGIEDSARSAGGRELVPEADRGLIRVPLVDVRALWPTRGELFGRYNVPETKRGLPAGADFSGRTAPRGVATHNPEALQRETLKPDLSPYSLADMVRLCLSRLPGDLRLADSPAVVVAEGIVPLDLEYHGERPAEALGDLLGAWNYRLIYDPIRDEAALWRFDEGRPNIAEEGPRVLSATFPTSKGGIAVRPETINLTRSVQHFMRPPAVRVLGRPIVREATVDLVLAGEVNGEVVPLDIALAWYGMTVEEAGRWVLLPPEKQSGWRDGKLNSLAVEAIRAWAFRWAMIPYWARGYKPILRYRARSMVDGSQRVPVVWADGVDNVKFSLWKQKIVTALANLHDRALAEVERLRPLIDAASMARLERALGDIDLEPAPFTIGWKVTARLRVVLRLLYEVGGDIFSGNAETDRRIRAIAAERLAELTAELADVERRVTRERIRIANSEVTEARLANVHARISPALYSVDSEGVVRFRILIGHIEAYGFMEQNPDLPASGRREDFEGTATTPEGRLAQELRRQKAERARNEPLYVRSQGRLRANPSIRMLFAYDDKPEARRARTAGPEAPVGGPLDKSRDVELYYSYLGRLKGGKVEPLNPGGVEPSVEETARLYVRLVKHDLRQYADIDGATNRGDLDAFAEGIIRRELEGDAQAAGHRGESGTFWPIVPTGAISQVAWEVTQAGEARTNWTSGIEKPVEVRQQTGLRISGTSGLGSAPGSVSNPDVGQR